jgi:hypothetical protein
MGFLWPKVHHTMVSIWPIDRSDHSGPAGPARSALLSGL